ncbi:MAG: HI0074 family nucleotidyltransferase substrate-binding subunit [Thermoguttaceae bacterium]
MNLPQKIRDSIVDIAAKYADVKKVVLFGSRARGDNGERSDVDLAIYLRDNGHSAFAKFCDDVDEIGTLLEFDLIVVDKNLKLAMVENIESEGVVLVEKLQEKVKDYVSAVERLGESLVEYNATKSTTVRDGAIQRFEFSTELAWKTAREYLTDQGLERLNSPKAIMKQAFSYGLVDDSDNWIDILDDRNMTSHIYDEELVNEVFSRIVATHYSELKKLSDRLQC